MGGEIDRDDNGKPTGILRESAKDIVKKIMPVRTISENASKLATLSSHLLEHGITGITELVALHEPIDYLSMYKQAQKKGLKQRIVIYYTWEEFQKLEKPIHTLLDRNNSAYIGGVKLFADGSISGQTALLGTPYENTLDNYGIKTTDKKTILEAVKACRENGLQLSIHAMRTQAIDFIIDTVKNEKSWLEDIPSIRIEHASLPSREAMEKAASAGIAFVPQPIFVYAEIESYLHNIGIERTKFAYPLKTILEKGIQVALSSDAPATAWSNPVDPFVGIKSAVTRTAYDGTDFGKEERIDIETAIILYTKGAQEVTGLHFVGQLKIGYQADFIVLDKDIINIESEKIDKVRIKETYINGELVYKNKIYN